MKLKMELKSGFMFAIAEHGYQRLVYVLIIFCTGK